MKSLAQLVSAALLALTLMACGGGAPTIDLSSEQAFEQSLQAVTEDLDEERRMALQDAISSIMMDEMVAAMQENKSDEEVEASLYEQLHGKTADEIIASRPDQEASGS